MRHHLAHRALTQNSNSRTIESMNTKLIHGFSIAVLLFSTQISCASPNRPISDHFDGKKFHNPEPNRTKLKSFWDVMKWQWGREKSEWPQDVEVKPKTEVQAVTKDKQVAVTLVNHSTFLIQTQSHNFLTDPIWSDRSSPFQWAGPKRSHAPAIPFDILPQIHYVMVSHNHYDHLDKGTLQRLNEKFKPQVLVPLGDKDLVEDFGVNHVHELDWGDEIKVTDDVKIIFARCQHWSARGLFDKNDSLWGSYMLIYKGKKIYFAGDTGYSTHFKEIEQKFGPVDLALFPIGAYLPRDFMKDHHMNPAEAVQAHLDLKSKKSIAMHYGTFQLSDEKYEQPKEELKKALEEKGIPLEQFQAAPFGETIVLD